MGVREQAVPRGDGGRVLQFSLYETLRWKPRSGYTLLHEHMQRMRNSAGYFSWNIDTEMVVMALNRAQENFGDSDQRVRVDVSPTGVVNVTHSTFTDLPNPYRVRLAIGPVSSANQLLYHKTTCRDVYDSARAEAGPCDDVVLWNEKGEITESCRANILVESQGEWLTPGIDCGLLNGLARQQLLDRREVRETVVNREDLLTADSIWLINSVRGRWQAELLT